MYYGRRAPQRRSYGYRGQQDPIGAHEDDVDQDLGDLGEEFFDVLGVETDQSRQRRRGRDRDPDGVPDDAWDQGSGRQRRLGLSDWVTAHDDRASDPTYDPQGGYLIDDDDDPGGEGQDNGLIDWDRGAQNLDGLVDMDSMGDQEMRLALRHQAGVEGGRRLPSAKAMPVRLSRNDVRGLTARFRKAQARAIRHETQNAGGKTVLVPSVSAQRWASDQQRIARVLDPHMRINDMDRAMGFFAAHSEALQALKTAVDKAGGSGRRQFGDYAHDILQRLGQRRQQANPNASSRAAAERRRLLQSGDRMASRARVGRISGSRGPPARVASQRQGGAQGGVGPLDVPVFSRASWTMRRADPGSGEADDESYYISGNARFLAARLGLKTPAQQRLAQQDAVRFFKRRFGLDFSPKAGALPHPKNEEALVHGSLPAVLEAYTVSAQLESGVTVAEGNLASSNDPCPDPIRNGLRLYRRDDDLARTSVSEAGWMVRDPLCACKALLCMLRVPA